ncbi:MAG: AAA family ATPase [Methanosarcinaceae archaeon]|nr:AAA family ATPase [Methanosarcinaceae archaeon]
MTRVIAITGKGGTGKTAVAALLIRYLTKGNKVVLAIDADPDTNLPETLGCDSEKTLGDVREFILNDRDNLPPDINKESIFESRIYEVLVEMPRYDLLVMGRSEGASCYCYINNLLRSVMERLVKNYNTIIIDTAAGLEHFSRKTIRNVDDLIVVTDGSRRGFRTAERIHKLVDEVEIEIGNIYVVANKVTIDNKEKLIELAKELNLQLIGMVPLDEKIAELDLKGESLVSLPEDSPAMIEVEKIAKKLEL